MTSQGAAAVAQADDILFMEKNPTTPNHSTLCAYEFLRPSTQEKRALDGREGGDGILRGKESEERWRCVNRVVVEEARKRRRVAIWQMPE
ncbi:hypothetical protein V9T40_007762 [Parthenolecanium corni]|uniref:Uncharacterized protein n=1 Tax=Parthenolecanium corni TaxID=536013 RepID=A0AAN9THP5_9HEMI